MKQAELLDFYITLLRQNPAADPPADLKPELARAARRIGRARRDPGSHLGVKARVWGRVVSETQFSSPSNNGKIREGRPRWLGLAAAIGVMLLAGFFLLLYLNGQQTPSGPAAVFIPTVTPYHDGQITAANADQVMQLTSLEYHAVPVPAWSTDGRVLAVVPRISDTTYLCLYEFRRGAAGFVAVPPNLVVGDVLSRDGTTLATDTGRETPELCDWDPATQEEPAPLVLGGNGDESVLQLLFSPDASSLAVVEGCAFGEVALSVWDPASGELLLHETSIRHGSIPVAFSPDGKTLAYGFENGWIHLWNVENREQRAIWKGHEGRVTSLAFSRNKAILASGSEEGTVKLWDATSGTERGMLEGHADLVIDLVFSPDGTLLASASEDGTVRLWDVDSGEERAIFSGYSQRLPTQLVFSPDGTLLASGGWDGIVRLWHVTPKTASNSTTPLFGSLAFSADGTLLATSSEDGAIHFWDTASGEKRATLHADTWASNMAFSPDGTTLITWNGAAIRVWGLR